MTAVSEKGQLVRHSPVRKPEDLARSVSSKNDKELYIEPEVRCLMSDAGSPMSEARSPVSVVSKEQSLAR
ncbi:MAG: hypothetical protein IPL46_25190 [Saprospiraceae bacterium]|nr:hypothetical protein [Saprospiraceae bacterium]